MSSVGSSPTPAPGSAPGTASVGTDLGVTLAEPVTAAAIQRNAEAILPVIEEEADAIEAGGRLTDRAARAMRAAGVFQMGFPARRGGVEMTLREQVDVVARIADVDASAAWNVGVLNATGYYAGRLGDEAYAELYPSRDLPTSGSFHPRGRAVVTDGGYLVSGNWDWGSGSYTADYVVGGCLVFDERGEAVLEGDGKQRHLGIWLPREAIVPADNWQTLGLRGSGSTSYSITTPAFVPGHHSFDREAKYNPGADPLNKSVLIAFFGLTGVVLGVARHAVRLVGDTLRARGAGALDAATKQALGEAMGEVDFTFAGVRDVAERTDEIIFSTDRELTPVHEARMTAANAMAGATLRRVLPLCMEIVSARYILDVHPLQRVLRDGWGALAHAGVRRAHLGTLAERALTDPSRGFTIPDDPSDAWKEQR